MNSATKHRISAKGTYKYRPELWKQLLYHREKWITPAMQAVIELLAEKK